MIRTAHILPLFLLSLLAATGPARAQTQNAAPPKLEQIEEGSDTPITVTAKPNTGRSISEKREQGRVTEVKVQSGKSSYTLKPNTPAGSALPGDMTGSANRGPQWQVMEFDLGKKKTKAHDEETADAPAPPPPAPAGK
ncbi:MAG: hypothetical protein V4754_21815 [Pseudomonadota bacterium]